MSIDLEIMSEKLKAIAHPVRLQMVFGLSKNECNVNKMVDALKLPQSTISQHLSILRSRGVIKARKDGIRTCYKVVDPDIIAILKVLKKR